MVDLTCHRKKIADYLQKNNLESGIFRLLDIVIFAIKGRSLFQANHSLTFDPTVKKSLLKIYFKSTNMKSFFVSAIFMAALAASQQVIFTIFHSLCLDYVSNIQNLSFPPLG